MLVIFTDDHVISPQQVCQNCLLANQQGLPRWHGGKLGCGSPIQASPSQVYQCQMGFKVAEIAETVFLSPES